MENFSKRDNQHKSFNITWGVKKFVATSKIKKKIWKSQSINLSEPNEDVYLYAIVLQNEQRKR